MHRDDEGPRRDQPKVEDPEVPDPEAPQPSRIEEPEIPGSTRAPVEPEPADPRWRTASPCALLRTQALVAG